MVDTDWRRTCGRQHPSGRVGTAGLPRALKRPKLQETAAGSSQSSAPLCGALRYQSHTGAISTSRTPYKRGFNRGTPGGQPYGPGVTPLASPSPCRFAADNASHRRPSSHHVLDSPQSNGTVRRADHCQCAPGCRSDPQCPGCELSYCETFTLCDTL